MLLAETFFVVVQSFSPVQLCDPMDCSLPGFPVLHGLPELVQTHVHWLGDAIQPSHPVSSPSSPTFSLFQHQSLFQWVGSSHQVAKVLELQLQHNLFNEYSGLISFRIYWFGSPCCPKVSRVYSNITIWKRQLFSTQPSLWSNSPICTWLLEKP